MNETSTKVCPRCKTEKTEREYKKYKSGPRKGKLYTYCKPCEKERNKEEWKKYKNKKPKTKKEKECKTCEKLLNIENFGKKPMTKDGWSNHCYDCRTKRKKERIYKKYGDWSTYYQETGQVLRKRFHSIKHRAKEKNIEFSLEYSYLEKKFEKEKSCYYCKTELEKIINIENINKTFVGDIHVDRKNNAKGYTNENIVICCWLCNQTKSNIFTEEEMLKIGKEFIKQKWEELFKKSN